MHFSIVWFLPRGYKGKAFYYIHKIYLVFVGVLLKNVFQFCMGGLIQSEVRQYMGIFGLKNSQNCQIWLKKVWQFMDTYSLKFKERNKVNREIKLKVFRLPLSTVAVFPLYSPHRHSVCLTFSLLGCGPPTYNKKPWRILFVWIITWTMIKYTVIYFIKSELYSLLYFSCTIVVQDECAVHSWSINK